MISKDVLTRGAVKPWHAVFIALVAYAVGGVAGDKLARGFDADLVFGMRSLLVISIASAVILAYTVIVPEFRRAVPMLFGATRRDVKRSDFALAFALMLCWGYGLYRAGFCLQALRLKPEWFDALGFIDALPAWKVQYLPLFAGAVLIAPVAEELLFRGFLLNLWVPRWGIAAAVIASSAFFGVLHYANAVFATGMGIVLALTYLRCDSLWPGIVLHAAYNLLSLNWVLGGFFSLKQRATVLDPANWIPEIALAILFFPAAWLFWKRFRPGSTS